MKVLNTCDLTQVEVINPAGPQLFAVACLHLLKLFADILLLGGHHGHDSYSLTVTGDLFFVVVIKQTKRVFIPGCKHVNMSVDLHILTWRSAVTDLLLEPPSSKH